MRPIFTALPAYAGAPHRRPASRAALRLVFAGLVAMSLLVVAGMAPADAQDRPPGGVLTNPVVRAIDLASPAVVRIATLYSTHLRLSACGATATLPASGAYTVGGLGSGAFVSANGDILTADHVVSIDRQSLDNAIFGGQQASADVATFLNSACHPSVPVTPDDVANGIVQFNGFPYVTNYSAPRVLVWRSASYFGTLDAGTSSTAATQLSGLLKAPYEEASVLRSSSFGENDLALLHVRLSDTPNIQLDSSKQLAVEDVLAVIGFPGNGDVNGDPTNLLTPSVNNVNISALKHNDNGSQLIQVGGNVEHGDSGGPALDTAGHIVGIVSFGGQDTQGITAFLRSSDSALELLNAAHIETAPGAFQQLWQRAFADYIDTRPGHWQVAAREMDTLSARYPDFHGMDVYRTYADAAAVREASARSGFTALALPLPVVAAIAVAILVLLALLIVVVSVRGRARRRARQRSQFPAPQNSMPFWPAAGPSQGYGVAAAPSSAPSAPAAPAAPAPYPATSYNVPASPTQPAVSPRPSAYPPSYGPSYGPSYAQPYPQAPAQPYTPTQYPRYAPFGNASQDGAAASQLPGQTMGHSTCEPTSERRPPSAPTPSVAPGSWGENGANGAYTASDRREVCANGHSMPPGVARCLVCGAEPVRPATSATRDANLPPWA